MFWASMMSAMQLGFGTSREERTFLYSFFFFWEWVSLCRTGWSQTPYPLASVSWVLEIQVCSTMSDYSLVFKGATSLYSWVLYLSIGILINFRIFLDRETCCYLYAGRLRYSIGHSCVIIWNCGHSFPWEECPSWRGGSHASPQKPTLFYEC
jgi:hypothetical protein